MTGIIRCGATHLRVCRGQGQDRSPATGRRPSALHYPGSCPLASLREQHGTRRRCPRGVWQREVACRRYVGSIVPIWLDVHCRSTVRHSFDILAKLCNDGCAAAFTPHLLHGTSRTRSAANRVVGPGQAAVGAHFSSYPSLEHRGRAAANRQSADPLLAGGSNQARLLMPMRLLDY